MRMRAIHEAQMSSMPRKKYASSKAAVPAAVGAALSALRDAQDNFMSVWLNYHAARMSLYRDLGVMRIDERGLWIDEPLEDAIRASADDCPLPPDRIVRP